MDQRIHLIPGQFDASGEECGVNSPLVFRPAARGDAMDDDFPFAQGQVPLVQQATGK